MSKSAPDVRSRILFTDTPSQIQAKIRGAVTDSTSSITYDPVNRPGTTNLLNILAACLHKRVEDVAHDYKNSGFKGLKEDVADSVVEFLRIPQEEFSRLRGEQVYLVQVADEGSRRAKELSNETMRHVRDRLGLC